MAKRLFKTDHTDPARIVWRNAVTDEPMVICNVDHLIKMVDADADSCVIHALRYGVAQIVQDTGALEKGAGMAARVAEMKSRVVQIESETYRLGQRGGMVDGDVFEALVALSIATDDAKDRAKWRDATKAKRDVLRRRPDVAKWLAEHADADESDAAVDAIFGAE